MLVRATRTVSAWTFRALLYGALFVVVVLMHGAVTSALREEGWPGGLALGVSGLAVLALVVAAMHVLEFVARKRAEGREWARVRQGLPSGPCCVVWRAGEGESDMPWEIVGDLRAHYPKLARRLGVEGVAVLDFEVNAEGRAKNVHVVDAWPSDIFYEAAKAALLKAHFQPRGDVHPRFGASYRMPFVFRIAGAARLKDRGRRAKPAQPAALQAATEVVEKLRRSA